MREMEPNQPSLVMKRNFQGQDCIYPIELLTEKVPWKYPNDPGCCQDNGCFSTNWEQSPIAKDNNIYTTHRTWRDGAGVYTEPSPQCSSVFDMEKSSASYQKRKTNPNLTTKLLICNLFYLINIVGQSMIEQTLRM